MFLSEVLQKYRETLKSDKDISNIRSLLNVHIIPKILPILGLEHLKNKKSSYIFDQIQISGFLKIADPIFKEAVSLLDNRSTAIVSKSQWKKFCDWVQQQDWYSNDLPTLPTDSETTKPRFTHIPDSIKKQVRSQKKVRERKNLFFSLNESELTPKLNSQIQEFGQFCTTITSERNQAIRDLTLKDYCKYIRFFLGWRKNIEGTPIDDLDATQMLDQKLLMKYGQWNRDRGIASKTIISYFSVVTPIAKYLLSKEFPSEPERISEKIKEIKGCVKIITVDRKDRPYTSDAAFAEREVSREQCWEILQYLGWRCKDLEAQQGISKDTIDAWMDYLIIALLVTTAPRQKEITEMQLSRLKMELDGTYFVHLSSEEHKTGSRTNKGREYPLFVGPMQRQLNKDLTYYIEKIRPKNLNHNYLFFVRQQKDGKKYQSLRGDRIVMSQYLAGRVTFLMAITTTHLYGIENIKWTTPHDFRRIIATWVCTYGKLEHLAIYAELLGHSIDLLVKIYNKMHPGELARQAPIAHEEISAKEASVTALKKGNANGGSPILDFRMLLPQKQIGVLIILIKKLWAAMTPKRRETTFAILTQLERQIIEEEI